MVMKDKDLAKLNAELAPINRVVRVSEQNGETVYQLCEMTPLHTIVNIEAFAENYGVNIKPE